MRLNVKVTATLATAALLAVASVAAAFGATPAGLRSVALQVGSEMGSGFTGSYGDEITLAPAVMDKIELPGEIFQFQVYMEDTTTDTVTGARQWRWLTFLDFEDVTLEDTNTVPPFRYRLGMDDKVILADGSSVTPAFPYRIRAEYKTFDSSRTVASTSPKTYSEEATVTLIKNDATRVAFSTVGAARAAATRFKFQVGPNCGEGTIRVLVSIRGMKARTYNVRTDEDGAAAATLKLGTTRGTYRVTAKFLGNMYGVASPVASKTVVATR